MVVISIQLNYLVSMKTIANFCRTSYLIASVSTRAVFTNQMKLFVNELFENDSFDLFSRSHENVSFLMFLIIPIFVSFFIQTSLLFIEICGAISFWIFGVIYIFLFSLFLKENEWKTFKGIFQLFLIAFAVLMFIFAIFCSIRDMAVYYFY